LPLGHIELRPRRPDLGLLIRATCSAHKRGGCLFGEVQALGKAKTQPLILGFAGRKRLRSYLPTKLSNPLQERALFTE
jgi:hypothetical protein